MAHVHLWVTPPPAWMSQLRPLHTDICCLLKVQPVLSPKNTTCIVFLKIQPALSSYYSLRCLLTTTCVSSPKNIACVVSLKNWPASSPKYGLRRLLHTAARVLNTACILNTPALLKAEFGLRRRLLNTACVSPKYGLHHLNASCSPKYEL